MLLAYELFNGFNGSDGAPLNCILKSEIDQRYFILKTGVEIGSGSWLARYHIGPHRIDLNHTFVLHGVKPTTPTSIYDRNESLDTRYFGGQLGASISKKISSDLLLDVGNDVSLLKMKGNYYGTDVHYAGGGSTVTHSLNKTAYSAHCSIGIRYVKTSGVFLGWAVIFIILAVSLQLFMRREQREMEPTSHHH